MAPRPKYGRCEQFVELKMERSMQVHPARPAHPAPSHFSPQAHPAPQLLTAQPQPSHPDRLSLPPERLSLIRSPA
eukprot:3839577-Prymnesium_polylepis.3